MSHLQVDGNEDIIVTEPEFFKKLNQLLANEPKRNLANYLVWRAVKSSLNYLNKDARELLEEYERNMTGKTANKLRWKTCVGLVDEGLRAAVGKVYVEKHFQEPAKQDMIEMVGYIKTEFGKILNEVDWMDEDTRYRAETKLNAITDYVGYPKELLEESKLEELYQDLDLKPLEFFQNSAKISVWKINTEWSKLRQKVIERKYFGRRTV